MGYLIYHFNQFKLTRINFQLNFTVGSKNYANHNGVIDFGFCGR